MPGEWRDFQVSSKMSICGCKSSALYLAAVIVLSCSCSCFPVHAFFPDWQYEITSSWLKSIMTSPSVSAWVLLALPSMSAALAVLTHFPMLYIHYTNANLKHPLVFHSPDQSLTYVLHLIFLITSLLLLICTHHTQCMKSHPHLSLPNYTTLLKMNSKLNYLVSYFGLSDVYNVWIYYFKFLQGGFPNGHHPLLEEVKVKILV